MNVKMLREPEKTNSARLTSALSILAISGSLRLKSTNTRLLKEIANNINQNIEFYLYEGAEYLPQFNPDKEDLPNAKVEEWIQKVKAADVFIVSTPEYAHGIPGCLKNALDWLVGTDAFIEKPFSLYHACPRSEHASKAIVEVLKTMSGVHISDSDITIDLRRNFDLAEYVLSKEECKNKIIHSICILLKSVVNGSGIFN